MSAPRAEDGVGSGVTAEQVRAEQEARSRGNTGHRDVRREPEGPAGWYCIVTWWPQPGEVDVQVYPYRVGGDATAVLCRRAFTARGHILSTADEVLREHGWGLVSGWRHTGGGNDSWRAVVASTGGPDPGAG